MSGDFSEFCAWDGSVGENACCARLGLGPQDPCKKTVMVLHACYPRAWGMESERSLRLSGCLLSQKAVSSRFSEKLSPGNKAEKEPLKSSSILRICTHVRTYTTPDTQSHPFLKSVVQQKQILFINSFMTLYRGVKIHWENQVYALLNQKHDSKNYAFPKDELGWKYN